MTNTSSPRTFSRISTKISLSEKRRMFAFTRGRASLTAMASASGLLLLPVRIFMAKPSIANEKGPDRDSDRGYVIDHDDAMEPPDIGLLVPFACPVQGATIVRHQHVARLPAMAVAEAVLDHVLQQLVVQRLRPVGLQAVDTGAPFAAEIEAARAKLGVPAHQRMNDVGDLLPLGFHLRLGRLGEQVLE